MSRTLGLQQKFPGYDKNEAGGAEPDFAAAACERVRPSNQHDVTVPPFYQCYDITYLYFTSTLVSLFVCP